MLGTSEVVLSGIDLPCGFRGAVRSDGRIQRFSLGSLWKVLGIYTGGFGYYSIEGDELWNSGMIALSFLSFFFN